MGGQVGRTVWVSANRRQRCSSFSIPPTHSASSQGLSRPSGAHSAMDAYLPPNLPTQREPEKEAGAGALPRTTPGKSRELERNLHQVAAGAAPLCARRPPAFQLSPGAA